jgi:hypothetical protein
MPASGEQPLQHIGQSWYTPLERRGKNCRSHWNDRTEEFDLHVIRPARTSPWKRYRWGEWGSFKQKVC